MKKEVEGTVLFFAHKEGKGFLQRLGRWILRTVSPRYSHCAVSTNGFVFHYGKRGYEVGTDKDKPIAEVSVKLIASELLRWESPKRTRLEPLAIALSPLFPFKNCATEISRVTGVKARTPDELYGQLRTLA